MLLGFQNKNFGCHNFWTVTIFDVTPVHWTPELRQNWDDFRQALVDASKRYLANYDPKQAIMFFTDASKFSWSLIVLQAPYD